MGGHFLEEDLTSNMSNLKAMVQVLVILLVVAFSIPSKGASLWNNLRTEKVSCLDMIDCSNMRSYPSYLCFSSYDYIDEDGQKVSHYKNTTIVYTCCCVDLS